MPNRHSTTDSSRQSTSRHASLRKILRSGYVTRWHSNPDLAHIRETLAEHHARVAQIILAYHPCPSLALIDAALHHDAGEMIVGDLPGPFKHAHPAISTAHARAENEALRRMGVVINLTPTEALWLKYADMHAAYEHVLHVAPRIAEQPEWVAHSVAMSRLMNEILEIGA
jgi:5'-deoxynucleotidase